MTLLVWASMLLGPLANAQEVILSLSFPDRIRISERANLSRTEAGVYFGLTSRQVVGYLTASGDPTFEPRAYSAQMYTGRMLVYEQTRRDMNQVGRPVETSYPAEVAVDTHRAFHGTASRVRGPDSAKKRTCPEKGDLRFEHTRHNRC